MEKIVHLAIHVPSDELNVSAEDDGLKRLVFYDHEAEYLFPEGSYSWLRGWQILGYFIVRFGGVHQGIGSYYFEKIDDTKVLLNPYIKEKKVNSDKC